MEIIIADNAGFCFGVKRAMDMAEESVETIDENLFSYGPLIHNPQVVEKLRGEGLEPISNIDECPEKSNIIIRSHGISKEVEDDLTNRGHDLIDTTCPFVKAVHKKVEDFEQKGYNVIIIGNSDHPEVIGINGWCNNKAYIVNSIEDVEKIPDMTDVCVVSQTTNTKDKFVQVSEAIKNRFENVQIFNTICSATKKRQESAYDLAKKVDAMVVIGGYQSSNTKKLAEISKEVCKNVFHIETIDDLSLQRLSEFNTIGVTAGASTPDWIIKEAVKAMDNLDNMDSMDMMEAIERSFTKINRGDIIEGEVLFVTDKEVMVNINYTSDGIISINELSNDPDVQPRDLFSQGDKISVYVMRTDDGEGNVVLSSKRVKDMKSWDVLEEKFESGELLDVKVSRVVKGGLIVLVEGINGFIPASHASARYVTDLDQFIGEEFKVKILDFDKQKRRLVLSRKEVEQKELADVRSELWDTLEVGQITEGTVQRLTNFGAFVDLGGVDGLIHISDLSWNRIKHPSEIVNPGDKVEVKVLDFDKERNRISLGLKQTEEKPWDVFNANRKVGDVVEGTVVNLLDFGAFVRLEEGVDGLLHVSQISHDHVNKPADVLELGQKIEVKIIDIDAEKEKISLSKKEAEEPVVEETVSEDSEVTIEDMVTDQE